MLTKITTFLIILILLLPFSIAEEVEYKSRKIEREDHWGTPQFVHGKDKNVHIIVRSLNNTPLDIYIMTNYEFLENYRFGHFFEYVLAFENETSLNFRWTVPGTEIYALVVDNEDNARKNDTIPTGDALVYIRYYDAESKGKYDIDFMDEVKLIAFICFFVSVGVGYACTRGGIVRKRKEEIQKEKLEEGRKEVSGK